MIKALILASVLAQDGAPVRGWRVTDTEVCADMATFEKHMKKDDELEKAVEMKPAFPVVWALIGLIIGGVGTYAVVKAGGAK